MGWEYLIKDALSVDMERESGNINIKVVGVGGAGCNSITRLSRLNLNAELIAISSDEMHFSVVNARKKLLIGKKLTGGRGTGGNINVGEQIVMDSYNKLFETLEGADIVFVLAGLGGGTGSGSGPAIAEIAKETHALVISVVTMPFKNEGKTRWEIAKDSVKRFREKSHTVIVLDNNRLLEIARKLPIEKAFSTMDYLVGDLIKNLAEAISIPSMINIDFSDLEMLMRSGGTSTILHGEGNYYTPQDAVIDTLKNPLLDIDYHGASGALIHITGGQETTLQTVYKIAEGITSGIRDDAEVKIGARIDERFRNKLKITTILTGVHVPFLPKNNFGTQYSFAKTDPIKSMLSFVE